jgi:hypothetical protein
MKTQLKTIKVNYEMKNGSEVVKRTFSLPISKQRYDQLASGLRPYNLAWHEVKEALMILVRLQGFTELGGWGVELKIPQEED